MCPPTFSNQLHPLLKIMFSDLIFCINNPGERAVPGSSSVKCFQGICKCSFRTNTHFTATQLQFCPVWNKVRTLQDMESSSDVCEARRGTSHYFLLQLEYNVVFSSLRSEKSSRLHYQETQTLLLLPQVFTQTDFMKLGRLFLAFLLVVVVCSFFIFPFLNKENYRWRASCIVWLMLWIDRRVLKCSFNVASVHFVCDDGWGKMNWWCVRCLERWRIQLSVMCQEHSCVKSSVTSCR